ncbi:hypothetical protein V2G26_003536 [Clonostachys chloroleuca]
MPWLRADTDADQVFALRVGVPGTLIARCSSHQSSQSAILCAAASTFFLATQAALLGTVGPALQSIGSIDRSARTTIIVSDQSRPHSDQRQAAIPPSSPLACTPSSQRQRQRQRPS